MRKILLLTVFVLSFITSSAQSTFTSNIAARANLYVITRLATRINACAIAIAITARAML